MGNVFGNTKVENVWKKNLEAAVVPMADTQVETIQMAVVQTIKIMVPEMRPEVKPEIILTRLIKTSIEISKKC